MTEEWRNSEAQVISRGQWTKLNGTDVEVLIPKPGPISSAFGDGSVSPDNVVIRVRRSSWAGTSGSTPGGGGGEGGTSGGASGGCAAGGATFSGGTGSDPGGGGSGR